MRRDPVFAAVERAEDATVIVAFVGVDKAIENAEESRLSRTVQPDEA